MVETNSAAALLDVNTGGKNATVGGRHHDDGGAFSREFERVSRGTEARSGPQPDGASATAEHEAVTQDDTQPVEQDEVVASGEEIAEQVIAAGGKDLPPVAAVEEEEVPEDTNDATLSLIQAETAQEVPQAIVQQEAKQALAVPVEVVRQSTVQSVGGKSQTDSEGSADESISFSNLRLRDMNLANMPAPGKESGDRSTAQQGKSDGVLFTLVNGGNRSAGAFTEILNTSAPGAVVSNVPTAQPASTLPAQMSIAVPLQQHGWDQAVGERVVWIARSNIQHAQIQLNPRELGPIEIKISVQNDQTHVNFVAHHATTRDAIEAALPRLREMLGEQGLNLGQADVSQHSFGGNPRQSAVSDNGHGGNAPHHDLAEDGDGDETILHHGRISSSAVDYFA